MLYTQTRTEAHREDLAILGAKPAFQQKLHVGQPNVGDRQAVFRRFDDIFDRKWFTNAGPCVQELEQRIAAFLGVKHCLCMCNGTVAMEIAARACGLQGEVIVPAFTFVATAHALQWQEITPVFCDVDPLTHSIDPSCIEKMITPRTTGIVGVHVWGRPCQIQELESIARKRNLQLLFDAAHAFGCSYGRRMIGSFGNAEVFSFHATKFFNTFEGGAVTTNDDALAEKMGLMRNFGFAGVDRVIYVGTNGKMNEFSAAMGLTGLDCLGDFIDANRRNYLRYKKELSQLPGLRLVQYDASEECNYQYVVVEVDPDEAGLTRDELVRVLHTENVLARRYFYPGCHHMEPYRSYFPHASLLLKNTERLTTRVMSLPTGTNVSDEAVGKVCRIIQIALKNADLVRERLATMER